MACILALDTSSEACSAAVIKDGKITSVYAVVPRDHTRKIIPMIQQVLEESKTETHQLDAIAFGRGPGSFTGLRIAAGVTQGLAYGLDIKVIPVSTLEAMALEVSSLSTDECTHVVTAIDARMDEVYWGAFEVKDGQVSALQAEQVCKPEAVNLPENQTFSGVGTGWEFLSRMSDDVQNSVAVTDDTLLAKAEYIARIAERKYVEGYLISAEQAIPVYLRDTVTWKKLPGR
jgi:tRNA threonylcarbamoyladenosine biosynthesis protein TsaB